MNVNSSLVLVLLGEDRPGLVQKVSSLVTSHRGNWLESHLSEMVGYFGGMIHVTVPASEESAFVSDLRDLENYGMRVLVQVTPAEEQVSGHQRVRLEVVGNDRPGIVNKISAAIAAHRINLEKMESDCTSAPMSGMDIFTLRAELEVPEDVSLAQLRSDLERIAADLMVDITFRN